MSAYDILEWTMGWSWPIITGLTVLMVWGIVRFLAMNEEDRAEDLPAGQGLLDPRCSCQCRMQP